MRDMIFTFKLVIILFYMVYIQSGTVFNATEIGSLILKYLMKLPLSSIKNQSIETYGGIEV
jgi:hypothetical protein